MYYWLFWSTNTGSPVVFIYHPRRLVQEFTEGFYGAAAASHVQDYLSISDKALRARGVRLVNTLVTNWID